MPMQDGIEKEILSWKDDSHRNVAMQLLGAYEEVSRQRDELQAEIDGII
jgi:hypothetical protein